MCVCVFARVCSRRGGFATTVCRIRYNGRMLAAISGCVRYNGGMPLYRNAFVPSGFGTAISGTPLFRMPLYRATHCRKKVTRRAKRNSILETQISIIRMHEVLHVYYYSLYPLVVSIYTAYPPCRFYIDVAYFYQLQTTKNTHCRQHKYFRTLNQLTRSKNHLKRDSLKVRGAEETSFSTRVSGGHRHVAPSFTCARH